jgi:hypothetical protein
MIPAMRPTACFATAVLACAALSACSEDKADRRACGGDRGWTATLPEPPRRADDPQPRPAARRAWSPRARSRRREHVPRPLAGWPAGRPTYPRLPRRRRSGAPPTAGDYTGWYASGDGNPPAAANASVPPPAPLLRFQPGAALVARAKRGLRLPEKTIVGTPCLRRGATSRAASAPRESGGEAPREYPSLDLSPAAAVCARPVGPFAHRAGDVGAFGDGDGVVQRRQQDARRRCASARCVASMAASAARRPPSPSAAACPAGRGFLLVGRGRCSEREIGACPQPGDRRQVGSSR